MKRFLDASILVEACLLNSSNFDAAEALVISGEACTSAHALAEAYATLSGDKRLRIDPHDAAGMVADAAGLLEVSGLDPSRMLELIQGAPARGVYGGSFYDAIHAEAARQMGCEQIHTLNVSHFRHVAPDLEIVSL